MLINSIKTATNCSKYYLGFFPNQQQDGRYAENEGYSPNFLSYPGRVRDRLTTTLHLRPNGNSEYVYPFRNRPISTNGGSDRYGRPLPPYQNVPNRYPQRPYEDYSRPVQFPNSGELNNNQYQYYNQYPSGGN